MSRRLWVKDQNDQKITVGQVSFEPVPFEGIRIITCEPGQGIRPYHGAISWAIQQLHELGYTPKLYPDARIELEIPIGDHYGGLLSRIAWAYYRAGGRA